MTSEAPFLIYGVVHLRPLPGAPDYAGRFGSVLEQARDAASVLLRGGVDGLVVENYGDAPFFPGQVPAETVAALTRAVHLVRELAGDRPVGVNVLRNDARAALAIAGVCGADFIRVNVHQGTVVTDQGLITGRAHETLRVRPQLAPRVKIFADAAVKHGAPLAPRPLSDEVADLVQRGRVDAVLITGCGTGRAVDPQDVVSACAAAGPVPVWIASGFDAGQAANVRSLGAHGAIVGSSFERDGVAGSPVEFERVRTLMRALGRG